MKLADTFLGRLFSSVSGGIQQAYNIFNDPEAWQGSGGMGGSGRKTTSGEKIDASSALKVSTYFAGLRNVSEDIGKVPLEMYKRMVPRGKEDLPEHPIELLFQNPNPEITEMAFRETLQQWAMGWGKGCAEIERSKGGDPIALWQIHPSRVLIFRSKQDGNIYFRVYSDDIGAVSVEYVDIAQADMFHIKGMGNGIEGYSLLKFAAECLGLSLASQTFGASFFGNGANVGGVLIHPGTLSKPAADRLKQSYKDMYSGAGKGNQLMVTEEGMTYKRIGIPPEEAQFLETRLLQVVEFCRYTRIPPHKLQHLDNATFSNIEQQSIEYVTDCLTPWFVRWEQEIKRKLVGSDGKSRGVFARHKINSLMRGDSAARSAYYTSQHNVGAMSSNDIREEEDRNPIPGGDKYFVQQNLMPLDMVEEVLRSKSTKAEPPGAAGASAPQDKKAFAAAYRSIFLQTAERLAKREHAAIMRAAEKNRGLSETFGTFCQKFANETLPIELEAYRVIVIAIQGDLGAMHEYLRLSIYERMLNACKAFSEPEKDFDSAVMMDTDKFVTELMEEVLK